MTARALSLPISRTRRRRRPPARLLWALAWCALDLYAMGLIVRSLLTGEWLPLVWSPLYVAMFVFWRGRVIQVLAWMRAGVRVPPVQVLDWTVLAAAWVLMVGLT